MALAIIRELTDVDQSRLHNAAMRFCRRHKLAENSDDPIFEIDCWIDSAWPEDRAYRRRLWLRVMASALRVDYDARLTIGWGHVGLSTN